MRRNCDKIGWFCCKKGVFGYFAQVNFHLYHYAGNNPVKYTDPDGRVLYISGDEDYTTGVLKNLQKLTNDKVQIDSEGKVTVLERKGFWGFVYNLFHKSKTAGTGLLRELCDDSNKKCTIMQDLGSEPGEYNYIRDEGSPNASNGIGIDCAISFNPNVDYSKSLLRSHGILTKNSTVLAHELVHAYYDITGGTSLDYEDQAVGLNDYSNAPFSENKIRLEQESRKNNYRSFY